MNSIYGNYDLIIRVGMAAITCIILIVGLRAGTKSKSRNDL
ncbi:MAG TPA: hypothetical protein VGG71_11195 [Chitinophagaceae bacterium]